MVKNVPLTLIVGWIPGIMPAQAEFCLRNWVKFNPLIVDDMYLHKKEDLEKGR